LTRDLDLIRVMMLTLEADPRLNGRAKFTTYAEELFQIPERGDDVLAYHLMQIIDEGWLEAKYLPTAGKFDVIRLTAAGHDFIDSTRNPDVWERAQSAMKSGGTATLRFAWDIAKSIAKKEIEKRISME
jgi:hypothetical protein